MRTIPALLGTDRRAVAVDVAHLPAVDGVVARRGPGGVVRRAEPGPAGPLVLEAHSSRGGVELAVWGARETPPDAIERALAQTAAWVGLDDRLDGFAELVDADPVLRRARRQLPPARLSVLPRVGESFGRAVLGQLVQVAEARRSCWQVARRLGTAAPHGLWCWPTAQQVGAAPAWELRRCAVSLRGARALHAGALADQRMARHARAADWAGLDHRLRRLPGVGVWTSAETRLALGDPDAVSVGDYHLAGLVGFVLAGDRDADDEAMLALLAPFAPHRGRVVRLIERAAAQGIVAAPRRRAPRAELSAHRYW